MNIEIRMTAQGDLEIGGVMVFENQTRRMTNNTINTFEQGNLNFSEMTVRR